MENIVTTLQKRGLIDAVTSEELGELLSRGKLTCYVGFDPTADSLHIGNLVAIMGLAHLQRAGCKIIAVVGGATGMVGDPSGKSQERNLLDQAQIAHNLRGIEKSLRAVLKDHVTILNNYDWFHSYGVIDFLRDVGKHFRMGTMLSKESVKNRLQSEEGMSFTEFSYQLLQGYDFLHLFDNHGVTLQMGGSDQWGNIVGGVELVRKVRGKSVYGMTFPLVTRSDGKKFGKSEEGTIWLNQERLSPYEFFQYFYRTPDADVAKFFRLFTFLELKEIEEIMREGKPHEVGRRLAEEVTKIVHGKEAVKEALSLTEAARPGEKVELRSEVLIKLAKELPSYRYTKEEILGKKLLDIYLETGLLPSKGEARRLIQNGGAYLNNEKVEDEHFVIEKKHLIDQKFLLLQVGKKKKMVVSVE